MFSSGRRCILASQSLSTVETKFHTDRGGYTSAFDLLVSCGVHKNCKIEVLELGASFHYNPGTVLFICGFFLQHGVLEWEGGRVCYAHYIKDRVHERNNVPRAEWEHTSTFKQ